MSQADPGEAGATGSAGRRRRRKPQQSDSAVVADSHPGAPDPFAPTVPPASSAGVPPPPLATMAGHGPPLIPTQITNGDTPTAAGSDPPPTVAYHQGGGAAPPTAPANGDGLTGVPAVAEPVAPDHLARVPQPRWPGLPIDVAPGALDLGGRPQPPPLTLPSPTGEHRWRRGQPWAVQGRRTRRVVRRIDTWTVLKVSVCFYFCAVFVLLVAGVVLWNVASTFNVITNVEKFIRSLFDLQTFHLRPWVIFEYSALGGLVLVILGTGINVLVTVLYNLISDVFGGVQVFVLEDQDL